MGIIPQKLYITENQKSHQWSWESGRFHRGAAVWMSRGSGSQGMWMVWENSGHRLVGTGEFKLHYLPRIAVFSQ